MTGFFTREIREKGGRCGFSITTLDGHKGILAHIGIGGRFRVGRYGVNIDDIEKIAVPSMIAKRADDIIIIDEIGKMECFSELFKKTLMEALDSENPVLGSIALRGVPFIEDVKGRKDVQLIEITESNRDRALAKVYSIFG